MQTHRIHEMRLEARSGSRKAASTLQQQLVFWVHTKAFQDKLEQQLNNLVDKDTYLYIPNLDLEVVATDQQSFLETFSKALEQAITIALQKSRQSGDTEASSVRSKGEQEISLCLQYLKTGLLPAKTPPELVQAAQKRLLQSFSDDELWKYLTPLLAGNQKIAARLFFTIGTAGVKQLLVTRGGVSSEIIVAIEAKLHRQTEMPPTDFYTKIIQLLAIEPAGERSVQNTMLQMSNTLPHSIDDILPKKITSEEVRSSDGNTITSPLGELQNRISQAASPSPEHRSTAPKTDRLLVSGAGVVLLWTRLKAQFKKFGWITGKFFSSELEQQKAICWLHYLVYGSTETIWENDLLLNKILTGFPITEIVDTTISLTAEEKEAAQELLTTLLTSWLPNRSFSIDWLRTHFLNRTGTLEKRFDDTWRMQIEAKTEDILLKTLPATYSYSIIRYSWMKGMLFVEWNQ